jgi:hypothetical protein
MEASPELVSPIDGPPIMEGTMDDGYKSMPSSIASVSFCHIHMIYIVFRNKNLMESS